MPEIVDLSGKRILVVEDDEMNFIYLTQIFKLTKGEITRAKNGKEALTYAQDNRYDIILMDIQLPDISGNEVTRQIRTFDSNTPRQHHVLPMKRIHPLKPDVLKC